MTDGASSDGSGRAPQPGRQQVLVAQGDAELDVLVDGSGPSVVLLPSSLRDSQDFDVLAGLIASQGLQVLRPQPRGMGRSSAPPPGMTLETLADDAAAVIVALADGPAIVLGHAYGHWVARVTGLRHPGLVRGVVALGAAAREFPAGMADSLLIASDPERPREARLAALRHCMFAPGNDPSAWLEGWYPQWRAAYRAASQWPPRDAWYGVAGAPLLDLPGDQDAWRPPSTRHQLAEALGPSVTVEVIAGAGHALVPEQPHAIAHAVVAWARTIGHLA